MFRVALLVASVAGLPGVTSGRAAIPAGSYRPLYAGSAATRIHVAAFAIDRDPVTRGEFQAFVRTNSAWQRGVQRGVFAEANYLSTWASPTDAGRGHLSEPVTEVSWFAAKAYCATRSGRLPTVDEWEYVAAASVSRTDASRDPRFIAAVLRAYATRSARGASHVGHGEPNAFGVRDLHALVWEWTADFNSVLVSDDSRANGAGGDERDRHLFCASAAVGATDPSDYAAFLRYAFRAGLTGRTTTRALGFRCAAAI